jgi:5'-deoxynucleotidase
MTHDVNRWHANACPELRNSGDTISAHQKRCGVLIRQLWPDASDGLVRMAECHDEAEKVIGDMPYPAKRDFPALAAVYEVAERHAMLSMGLPVPKTGVDHDKIKLVDRIDAYRWMMLHAPWLEADHEWDDALACMIKLGNRLYISTARIMAIINGEAGNG